MAPRTWVAGETLTAGQLNEQLRDNIVLTAPGVVTTAGDVVYASAANTPTRLAAGTDGAPFVYDTGTNAPTWPVDATAVAVDVGWAGSNTITLSESTTYTAHASAAFALPTGWVSAEILTWGSVSVSRSDNNQGLSVKMTVGTSTGTSTGTVMPGGSIHTFHDMSAEASHRATVTANSTMKVLSTVTGSTIKNLVGSHAVLSFIAVRKS